MNLKNNFHFVLLCTLCLLNSCLLFGTKETAPAIVPEFKWAVLLSAPKFYRASIEFSVFHGAETEIASGTLFHGWGEVGPGMIVMDEPRTLPDSAIATWHSYAEGMDYKASFKLDTIKIKECFKKNKNGRRTEFCCAVAPGGVAVVWVISFTDKQESGIYNRIYTEVARSIGVVTKTRDPNYKKLLLPSELYWLGKHGLSLGNWDAWPKQYLWKPLLIVPEKKYVNNYYNEYYLLNSGQEIIKNWDSNIIPTNSWIEIEKDSGSIVLRDIPTLAIIRFEVPNKNEMYLSYFVLPRKKLIDAFEKSKKEINKYKRQDRIVFEIKKNNTVIAWLYGGGKKIQLEVEDALPNKWEEKLNYPKKNK